MINQESISQQKDLPSGNSEIPGAADPSTGDQQGIAEMLRNFAQLVGGFSGLVLIETRLAIASLPRYLELAFLKLFMLVCIWLSLSGCLMWLVFLASGSVMTGLIAMTGLQVAGYFICKKMQDVHLHRLGLPNTRRQLVQLGETINESIKAATDASRAHRSEQISD